MGRTAGEVPNLEQRLRLARQLGSAFQDLAAETASLVYM